MDEVTDVGHESWLDAAHELQAELGESLPTLLSAAPARSGRLLVVVRVWSPASARGVRLQTEVPYDDLVLPTLTGLWPGLGWWEREAAETWGLVFAGHPDPRPLLGVSPEALDRREEPWPGTFDPLGRRAPKPLGSV